MSERPGERSGEEAIDEIREKREEGEDLSSGEQEFLESEGVQLDPDEGSGRPVA